MSVHHGMHRGWWRGRRGGELPPPDPRRIEAMLAAIEQHLGITAAQRPAWDRLTEVVRDSAEALQIARGMASDAEDGTLARFTGIEIVTDVAAGALRRIRPALESLYCTLDAAQRQTLDTLIMPGPHPFGACH
jgi:hypothetical protein